MRDIYTGLHQISSSSGDDLSSQRMAFNKLMLTKNIALNFHKDSLAQIVKSEATNMDSMKVVFMKAFKKEVELVLKYTKTKNPTDHGNTQTKPSDLDSLKKITMKTLTKDFINSLIMTKVDIPTLFDELQKAKIDSLRKQYLKSADPKLNVQKLKLTKNNVSNLLNRLQKSNFVSLWKKQVKSADSRPNSYILKMSKLNIPGLFGVLQKTGSKFSQKTIS